MNTVSDAGSSRGGKDGRGQVNVEASFTKYDADGSGSVSITELGLICADLGVVIPRADLELTMASLDADGSGQLERDEFMLVDERLTCSRRGAQRSWQSAAG